MSATTSVSQRTNPSAVRLEDVLYLLACALVTGILLATIGCAGPKAVYIQGGQGATASLDISVATGSGKISLTGPFTYCEERIYSRDANNPPTGNLCEPLKMPLPEVTK
jgi:hypothetical protein